ncbi:MAG: hypothetical protein IPF99_24270 [Deltaproteobacteria bacterium]|nr:hypothetical protein [Deltaproteobacteria bacterium]
MLADAFAERVAVALDRILRARAAQADESWGIVSQKTLPPWIHPDTYVEACRTGAIPGAKIWRRQWLAPREAVLAWVATESREAVANAPGEFDPCSLEAIVAATGGALLVKPK